VLLATQPLAGLKVLVVEDDLDSREVLSELLQFEGAVVQSAENAEVGMAALQRFGPDVLVSDIGLPGEDGHDFIRRCRKLADPKLCHVPAVALTAYTRPSDRSKALAAGFDEYVKKPVDFAELIGVVARLAALEQSPH
jgi:CheY-like chemotaxis protein